MTGVPGAGGAGVGAGGGAGVGAGGTGVGDGTSAVGAEVWWVIVMVAYPSWRGPTLCFRAAAPGTRNRMKLLVLTSEPVSADQLRDALPGDADPTERRGDGGGAGAA